MTDPLDLEFALLPEHVGVFLAHSAAQLISGAAVQPLRGFLSGPGADFDEQWQILASPRYLADLGLQDDPTAAAELAAALTWYVREGIVDDTDLATLAAAAGGARTDLAAALLETTHPASPTTLTAAAAALAKIERFWARTNASINGDNTDYADEAIGTAQAALLTIVADSATRVTVTPGPR